MATRAIVAEQPRDGGNQKNDKPEARNRRVLKDIGNLVSAPPVEPKNNQIPRRPITRNFGAQLLANAQAAAQKNHIKKPLVKTVEISVGNDAAAAKPKPAATKKKTSVSNQPKNVEDVILISSDEEKKQKSVSKKISGKSLTATLTARSKVACGLTKKAMFDIDAQDKEDELAAVEYVEDMYTFYKEAEDENRVGDYIDSQPEINTKMRAILVDWLVEVHKKFELMPETLYLTINIADRFLAVKTVPKQELQLVGISSMLIACKYEEIWAPEVSDFIAISDNAYVRKQVLLMEKAILGRLEWYLTVPTPYVFVVRYAKASNPYDKEMEDMTFFFSELGLMDYSTMINHSPSKISASAVYAARCTLKYNPLWSETLKHYTGYEENQIIDCAKSLIDLHVGAADNKFNAVRRKYCDPQRCSVAMYPPAKTFLQANGSSCSNKC